MSEASFEKELVNAVNFRFDKKYKRKDLMEWVCGKDKIEKHEGETIYFLEDKNIEVAFKNG